MTKSLTGSYLNCLNCNNECYIPKYRVSKFRYCSRSCGALHARLLIKKTCELCHLVFEHISSRCNSAKYCSRTCYHKAQSKKGKTTYKCKHCHISFQGSLSHQRQYCSKSCVGKVSKDEWKANYTTVRKNMMNRGLITSCNRCGYNEVINILGVHHKDHDRTNNILDNLEVLCPNCHSLEHMKHIVVHN